MGKEAIGKKYALTGGNIIDGTGAPPVKGALIVSAGKIESVCGNPDGCTIIDVSGCALLPGFVNAHAHPGFKRMGQTDLHGYDLDYLSACLSAGVTTIRDMGALDASPLCDVLACRNELNASGSYPRIISAGKFFAAPGGYGGAAPITVSSAAEAHKKVNDAIDAGVDFVKTSLENGFGPDTTLPKLSPVLLAAICNAARGRRVAAHLSQCEPLRTLVEAGITDAGHVPYEPMDDNLIRLMVEKGVTLTPTLTLYRMLTEKYGLPLLETAIDNVRRFASAGGTLAAGDDFIEPDDQWYRPGLYFGELEMLSKAGLSNLQVIRALTANGAEACGLGAVTGTLQAGRRADIVAVRGDPLAGLGCLKDVVVVLSGGRIVRDCRN